MPELDALIRIRPGMSLCISGDCCFTLHEIGEHFARSIHEDYGRRHSAAAATPASDGDVKPLPAFLISHYDPDAQYWPAAREFYRRRNRGLPNVTAAMRRDQIREAVILLPSQIAQINCGAVPWSRRQIEAMNAIESRADKESAILIGTTGDAGMVPFKWISGVAPPGPRTWPALPCLIYEMMDEPANRADPFRYDGVPASTKADQERDRWSFELSLRDACRNIADGRHSVVVLSCRAAATKIELPSTPSRERNSYNREPMHVTRDIIRFVNVARDKCFARFGWRPTLIHLANPRGAWDGVDSEGPSDRHFVEQFFDAWIHANGIQHGVPNIARPFANPSGRRWVGYKIHGWTRDRGFFDRVYAARLEYASPFENLASYDGDWSHSGMWIGDFDEPGRILDVLGFHFDLPKEMKEMSPLGRSRELGRPEIRRAVRNHLMGNPVEGAPAWFIEAASRCSPHLASRRSNALRTTIRAAKPLTSEMRRIAQASGRLNEAQVARAVDGVQTPGSGNRGVKGDVLTRRYQIEAKYRGKDEFRVLSTMLEDCIVKCRPTNRLPAVQVQLVSDRAAKVHYFVGNPIEDPSDADHKIEAKSIVLGLERPEFRSFVFSTLPGWLWRFVDPDFFRRDHSDEAGAGDDESEEESPSSASDAAGIDDAPAA